MAKFYPAPSAEGADLTANSPLSIVDDVISVDLSSYYTSTETDSNISTAIANLVDTAPETLDTLNELAFALGDDPNFATTVTNQIAGKADAIHTHAISDVTDLQTSLDAKAPLVQAINYQNADYTVQASDSGKILLLDTNCTTLTVPGNLLPDGGRIDIVYNGTATLTIAAGAGLNQIRSKDGAVTIDTQYAAATAFWYGGGDRIYLIGDLA